MTFLAIAALLVLPLQEDELRPAAQIVRELRAVHFPSFSNGDSPEELEEFQRKVHEGCRRIGELALELYRGYPQHPSTPGWMAKRWAFFTNVEDDPGAVLREVPEILAAKPTKELADEARYARTWARLRHPDFDFEQRVGAVAAFAKVAIDQEKAAWLWFMFLDEQVREPDAKLRLAHHIVEHYDAKLEPTTRAQGVIKQFEVIGKPVDFEFEDLLGSGTVTAAALRGKVVVLHFWGPHGDEAPAQMATIAALREEFPDDLAVVSVVLAGNTGGDDPVEYAKQRGATWPLYDEMSNAPSFMESFSRTVRVRRWPDVYVVGRDGRFADVNAGKRIEKAVRAALR